MSGSLRATAGLKGGGVKLGAERGLGLKVGSFGTNNRSSLVSKTFTDLLGCPKKLIPF